MSFPSSCKSEDEIKCITPPLLPLGALDMQNSLQYGDEEFELADLVVAIRNNSVEKVAVILGKAPSRSFALLTPLPQDRKASTLVVKFPNATTAPRCT